MHPESTEVPGTYIYVAKLSLDTHHMPNEKQISDIRQDLDKSHESLKT